MHIQIRLKNTRIAHYKNELRCNRYNEDLTLLDSTSILFGDYVEASQRILQLYQQQQAEYQRWREEYDRRQEQRVIQEKPTKRHCKS